MNQGKELDDGKAEFIVYSTMNQPENYKIVAILKTVPFYYVVKKGNTELLNEMNSGMEQMIIEAPDIVNSVNYNLLKLQNDLAYTEDENEFISSKKIVKIGFYKDTAPLAEVKENGEYSGIYIDVINHIKDSTGLNIEMYPIDRSEYAYDLIRNGTIDFLIGSSDSALDASDNTDVIGTHSFMDYNTVTVTNQDYQFDKDRNTTFALTSARRYWESFIYANFNYAKIEYYESAKDCLEAVRKGEADATLLNTIEYNYQSKNARFEKLIEWEAYRSKSQTVFVTSVTSDENLLSIINKACDRLSTEESQNIIYYHLNTPYHSYNVSDKLYNYRGFIIFIFAVSIVLVISISIIHRNRRNSLMILKEKNTQLEKASAAKTDFMSNMSHEIRTPMNAIIGMTKLAEDEVDDIKQGKKDEIIQLKEYLNDIDSSSQYLLGVLNDILDMSRIEGGKLVLTEEWVMPTEITSSCINMVKPLMEKKNINFFIRIRLWSCAHMNVL